MIKLGLCWLSYLPWLALIPLYICLTPVCIFSSSLFDWVMSWIVEDQDLTVLIILITQWALSALLICQLVINRRFKSIFFYEFVFFLMFSNFVMIGITYSLLKRYNFIEQLAAKICMTMILIFLAQKIKIKFKHIDSQCDICFTKMDQNCIILKCKHFFHEKCLWDWIYVKQQCPSCRKSLS